MDKVTTDTAYRAPPLVLMRFARGGKTGRSPVRCISGDLIYLLNQLKEDGRVNPIMISFNGSGAQPFIQLVDETASQAILRLIDRDALVNHLKDQNIALLIDKLNNLDNLDEEAAALLRHLFLDIPGRYLVFTSHYPVSIEANGLRTLDVMGRQREKASNRGIITVDMSLAHELDELRGMSSCCEGLTEEEAAWLGYIPSLVYCSKNDAGHHDGCIVTPRRRFWQMNITILIEKKAEVLRFFIRELMSGYRNPTVSRYYASFLSVDENSMIYSSATRDSEQPFASFKLKAQRPGLGVHSSSGYHIANATCSLGLCIFGLDSEVNPDLEFVTLPDECDTLEGAREFMNEKVEKCTKHILIYVSSANARYPSMECFVVYTANGVVADAKIMGFQMKSM
eukprot:scaffold1914_cov147-Ochromonas_danica.AAC.1